MKIHRVGNSLMVGIPVEIARRLQIKAGDEVVVREAGDHLVIEPRRDLATLFAEWDDTLDDASMEDVVAMIRADRQSH
jgi:AbrB family looped-hinge helix DNA binding protein